MLKTGLPGTLAFFALGFTGVRFVQERAAYHVPKDWVQMTSVRPASVGLTFGVPVICSDVPRLRHLPAVPGLRFAKTGDPADWGRAMEALADTPKSAFLVAATGLPAFPALLKTLQTSYREAVQ